MEVNYYKDLSSLGLSEATLKELNDKSIYVKGLDDSGSWKIETVEEAYLRCPYIRMILNAKVNAASNVHVKLFKVGKTEDVEVFEHPILTLLNNPNPLQDGGTFIGQRLAYQDLYSRTYIRSVDGRREGFNETTKALWNLPPKKVTHKNDKELRIDIYSKFDLSDIIEYFEYIAPTGIVPLYPENILYYSDFMFNHDTDSSDVKVLLEAVKNLMATTESRGEIIKHRGAMGMFTPKDTNDIAAVMSGFEKEKISILSQLKKMYGILRGQSPTILTKIPMEWVDMVKDVSKLRLSESQKDEFNTCCDLLSVPRAIFDDKSTYDNKIQSERKMYQDTIIPWGEGDAVRLTKKFELNGMYLKYDYSHLPIMQESKAEMAAASKAQSDRIKTLIDANVIDVTEARAELGYE